MRKNKPNSKARLRPANVTTHAYDPERQTLDVTFHNGKQYRYTDVPADLAAGFSDAGGSGSFLRQHIIGRHPHQLLDD